MIYGQSCQTSDERHRTCTGFCHVEILLRYSLHVTEHILYMDWFSSVWLSVFAAVCSILDVRPHPTPQSLT